MVPSDESPDERNTHIKRNLYQERNREREIEIVRETQRERNRGRETQ